MDGEIIEAKATQIINGSHHIASSTPAKLLEIAINRDLDIEKLERLMAMQEKWDKQQAVKSFYEAKSQFQLSCPEIPRNVKKNIPDRNGKPTNKVFHYADLAQILKTIKKPLCDFGLSIRFEQKQENGLVDITCILSHKDGHSEQTSLCSQPDSSGGKAAIHSVASAVTYLKRYTLEAVLGISATQDDDGDTFANQNQQQVSQQTQVSPTQTNFMPDDRFNKNLPTYKKVISEGKQTPNTIMAMIKSKGFQLTPNQFNQLSQG